MRTCAVTVCLMLLSGTVVAGEPESPFVATLRKGDPSGTGFVTRRQVDGPVREVADGQVPKARVAWAGLLSFMGLPDDVVTVETRSLVEVTRRRLREADADGDGRVTRTEIEAYADREPTPAARAAVIERLTSLDADGDGVVSPEEAEVDLDDAQAAEPLSLEKAVGRAEALALWQVRSVDRIFQTYAGPDGRLDIEDLARRLRERSGARRSLP